MQEITTIPAMGTATNMTVASTVAAMPTSYCLYARKSTEQDERQALSIDSQIKEMLELANREGLHIAEIRRESHSAKASGCRPEYNKLSKTSEVENLTAS